MPQSFQQHITNKTNKDKIKYLDISNNDLAGNANLSEFTNLKAFNAYDNKLENMEFLSTLPNKEQLTSLNFFGNQIKEIDLAWLLATFPKLEKINFGNNPIKAKNLNHLTSEQFNLLIEKMKKGNFQLNSYKGTVLMDLLAYAHQLANQGGNTQHTQTTNYLQNLIQSGNSTTQSANNQLQQPALVLGGLTLFGISLLTLGYLWGKREIIILTKKRSVKNSSTTSNNR